jgi:restriction endonuclease S subunit
VLDEFQSAAVFVNWWQQIRYDLKTVVSTGWHHALIPDSYAKKIFSHTVVVIKAKSPSRALNNFLLWAVRDREFFSQIDRKMNSNSGVPTLGVQFLSSVPIRLPLPEEQERIAQVLSQSEATIEENEVAVDKLRLLKVGLMQDLLTGRKRVTALLDSSRQHEGAYA